MSHLEKKFEAETGNLVYKTQGIINPDYVKWLKSKVEKFNPAEFMNKLKKLHEYLMIIEAEEECKIAEELINSLPSGETNKTQSEIAFLSGLGAIIEGAGIPQNRIKSVQAIKERIAQLSDGA